MTAQHSSDKAMTILYEFPLNEQVRTYLRLETLFTHQIQLTQSTTHASHISALHNLLEILDCLDRGDIKGDLLKELEQQKLHFQQLADNPYIDEVKLNKFLSQIEQIFKWLSNYPGKFGSQLRKERFIELINNRMRIPGGSCSFDLPELHRFLHQSLEKKQQQFSTWFKHFDGLYQSIKILLRLFRENASFEQVCTENAHFQYSFAKGQSAQLLRIRLPEESSVFPEVSGSKHCFNIRFLIASTDDIVASTEDHSFSLSIC
ncbi:cell division protein ZapD [Kangiella sp. HZ709]|uniref:cell division protein ZapD n=1 Tax=Kangiella sp. HZ709 TaxID=2666328 RepID=UPI001D0D90E9|nr:cell division protein ZapD [Kangiella sp. HZ709]